ncbi:phosphodiester glycosidase family protein [Paenibacillus enshidis]|uniref:Phosphodiester glycosidase family protein n=1 Tax=Paenibacillus enshidis TaxID=1458439 RepID=A0ABV5AUS2_9BACL
MSSWARKRWKKWIPGMLALTMSVSFLLSGDGIPRVEASAQPGIQTAVKKVTAAGRTFTVKTVSIPKGTPAAIGLAQGQVGKTQDLSGIVQKYHAEAAINGAFFEAYNGAPDPYGMLISGGKVIHIGRYGTTVGFKQDGTVVMDALSVSITGRVTGKDGRSLGWYATFMNRTPAENANTSMLYTPERGATVGFKGGIAVTVRDGIVVKNGINTNVSIPKDGYVLVFTGTMRSTAQRFAEGAAVTVTTTYSNQKGEVLDWQDVVTGVGAGPRLITDGKVSLNPEAEGFKDPKILNASGARSGIAIMPDGSVLLATVPAATMKQWAAIMEKLGAKQAMNLDGGASSGMYAGGKIQTAPGRKLSNTLIFGTNLQTF